MLSPTAMRLHREVQKVTETFFFIQDTVHVLVSCIFSCNFCNDTIVVNGGGGGG